MPHLPDHVTHDPELIAAYAAGDATGPALEQAADLVASCTECAELHRDLRAISTALPELPAPVRPRDFRLTPEQAAALRPAGWRGVLAAFAAPRFRLAAPLGAGLAAAGLAGLLLASPGGLLPRATGEAESGSAPSRRRRPAVQADDPEPRARRHHVRRLRGRRGAGRARGTLTGRRLGSGSRGRRQGRGGRPHPAGPGGRRRGSQRRRVIGAGPRVRGGSPGRLAPARARGDGRVRASGRDAGGGRGQPRPVDRPGSRRGAGRGTAGERLDAVARRLGPAGARRGGAGRPAPGVPPGRAEAAAAVRRRNRSAPTAVWSVRCPTCPTTSPTTRS